MSGRWLNWVGLVVCLMLGIPLVILVGTVLVLIALNIDGGWVYSVLLCLGILYASYRAYGEGRDGG